MRSALILIDLQQDYLARAGLEPAAPVVTAQAAELLSACRERGVPVWHVHTVVRADGSGRMPHWQRADLMACVEHTPGAAPPAALAPRAGEAVVNKTFYSGFDDARLHADLQSAGIARVILAGLYTHACVRSTVLDAYARGYEVWIAQDAVASCEPAHARITLEYLQNRAAQCMSTSTILEQLTPAAPLRAAAPVWLLRNPALWDEVLEQVPLADARAVESAAQRAQAQAADWAHATPATRAARLTHWLQVLTRRREELAARITRDVGKPAADARAECDYALALLRHAIAQLEADAPIDCAGFQIRHHARGVVGLITPWNNPVAIAVGKLAPALGYGNCVVWKPALPGSGCSQLLLETIAEAGLDTLVQRVTGGVETAQLLLAQDEVQAVSFTGSVAAGREVAALCGRHAKPLQAELGGNNAVLVLRDCAVEAVAAQLAPAIFSFAGQRCTAPRRLIVEQSIAARFESALLQAVAALPLGEPALAGTKLGPLISRQQQAHMAALTAQGLADGGRLLCGGAIPGGYEQGCWFAPTLIADPHPDSVVVQQESFGPVAVLLRARDARHALALCNATPYGLLATLYSDNDALQEKFLREAQAGMLVLNHAPPAIAPAAAFSGWKNSGLGPPEHGRWNLEFYARPQTIYRR